MKHRNKGETTSIKCLLLIEDHFCCCCCGGDISVYVFEKGILNEYKGKSDEDEDL